MSEQTYTLLVVEDNNGDARLIEEYLRESRFATFDIHHVVRLDAAIDVLENGRSIDVVLLDLSLPDSHGIDTFYRLSAHTRATPVVVLTGTDDDLATEAIRAGAQDYLPKRDLTPDVLRRVVRYAYERHRLEAKQQASTRRFREMIEDNADCILIIDQDNNIQYANSAAEELFGRPTDGLVGTAFEYPSPTEHATTLEICRPDGDKRTAELRARRLQWNDTPAMVASLRDITEKEHIRKALARSEALNSAILHSLSDHIAVVDSDGTILAVNDAWETFAAENEGNPPATGVGANYLGVCRQAADDGDSLAEQALAGIQRVFRGEQETFQCEYPCHAPDEERWFSMSVSPFSAGDGVVIAHRNITQLIETTQALEHERDSTAKLMQRYRLLAENATDLIVRHAPDGTYRYVSPAAEASLGYQPAEMVSTHPLDYVHPHDSETMHETIDILQMTTEPYTYQCRMRCSNGDYIWMETTCTPVVDEDTGQTDAVISVSRDVTSRHQRERELETFVSVAAALRQADVAADMPPIILEQTLGLLHAAGAAVVLYDSRRNAQVVRLTRGETPFTDGASLPADCFITHTINTKQAGTSDAVDVQFSDCQPAVRRGDLVAAAAPLLANGEAIGALWFARKPPIGDEDLRLLSAIADIAANAIHRANMHEQTRRRTEQLATVSRLGATLGQTLNILDVYAHVTETIHQLLPEVSAIFISRYAQHEERITCEYAEYDGEPIDTATLPAIPLEPEGWGIQSRVIRTGEPLIIDEYQTYTAEKVRTVHDVEDDDGVPHSALCVPMRAQGQILGVINIQSYTPAHFTEADADLLQLVANTCAIAISNADLVGELRQRLEQLQALNAVDAAITTTTDIQVMLNTVLETVLRHLKVDAAAILQLDSHTQELEHLANRGFYTNEITHTRLPVGVGMAGRAIQEQTIVRGDTRVELAAQFKDQSLLDKEGFRAYCAIPLVMMGDVLGVLGMFSRSEPLAPDSDWMDFAQALASQAAIAIDNAGMFAELQQANAELRNAYDRTIEGWARALDLRDEETEGHSRRVTAMTVELARESGVTGDALRYVRWGALLHDIGKMGMPDSILLKPGPLSDEQWQTMQQHPTLAYNLLSEIDFLRPALDIPHCHHEKWDGSGYPRGLKEEEIPLAARIFAVVDVYDALTSDRPYRDAWPAEKAIQHIRDQAGKHFDPDVVELFLQLRTQQK